MISLSALFYYGRSIIALLTLFRRPAEMLAGFSIAAPSTMRKSTFRRVQASQGPVLGSKSNGHLERQGGVCGVGAGLDVDTGAAIGEFTVAAAIVPRTPVLAYQQSASSMQCSPRTCSGNRVQNA